MHRRLLPVCLFVLFFVFTSAACELGTIFDGEATATPTPARPNVTPAPATPVVLPSSGEQPVLITGEFKYSNEFVVETYYVEHAVALVDMHGFVIRDEQWEIPVEGQVLGYMKSFPEQNKATFRLQLPAVPTGQYNDLSKSAKTGLQIFAVSYWPNQYGGPFSVGDDRSRGWPSYLASVITDSENKDEVIGGKLVIWSPDDRQVFPTSFGADKLLFTADDPLAPVKAGYSVIDLDQQPFGIERKSTVTLTFYEPKDVSIKDFSKDSYSQAFDKLVNVLRKEYAFNGITGKAPDWDKVNAEIVPRVKAAEQKKDAKAFYQALLDFSLAFKDGHVSLDGGDVGMEYLVGRISYGYGFAVREAEDGRVVVVFVLPGSPAQSAGIQVGAEITSYGGVPVRDAISQVKVFSPQSSSFGLRYTQAQLLTRASGRSVDVSVTFKNPNAAAKTVALKSVQERNSYFATSLFAGFDKVALPVEYRILDSGVGYIKINSNYDDLNLIIRLFERALKVFQGEEVSGLVIDMRQNGGGAPLGLAGFLTDKEIIMGQLQYYSEKTGKFEPEGEPEKVIPNENQYRFKKMALLVDQACFSACEIEAYGFSKVPGMITVGSFPTGGVEAEVARGQFLLPEGMSFQAPTGRFILPDGSLFLEGTGVQPTVKVPLTVENLLSTSDVVLSAAESRVK